MESPGEYIKRERELRGISLEQVQRAIKVQMRHLVALEEDRFDEMPPPAFIKGFIRSYSRYLGLDETDAVLRYELYVREAAEGRPRQDKGLTILPEGPREGSSSRYIAVFVAVGVLLIIIFYVAGTRIGKKEPVLPGVEPREAEKEAAVEGPEAPPVAEPEPEEPGPAVAPEEAAEAAPAAARPPAFRHTLVIDATDTVWVEVSIDGKEPFDVLLQKGERIEWRAVETFSLKVGNAGGVELTYDGKVLSPVGEAGKVERLTLPGWKPRPLKAPAAQPKRIETAPAEGAPPAPADEAPEAGEAPSGDSVPDGTEADGAESAPDDEGGGEGPAGGAAE